MIEIWIFIQAKQAEVGTIELAEIIQIQLHQVTQDGALGYGGGIDFDVQGVHFIILPPPGLSLEVCFGPLEILICLIPISAASQLAGIMNAQG